MHAHARPSLTLPQHPLHRARSLFLFRSFTRGVCRPPDSFFPTHTGRYTSLAKCAYHKHIYTSPLLFSLSMPPYVQYGSTQVHTPAPLFISHMLAHSSPLDMVGLSHHLLATLSPLVCLSGPYLLLTHAGVYMN